MLSKKIIYRIKQAAIISVLTALLITWRNDVLIDGKRSNYLTDTRILREIAFADTTQSVNIKVKLLFNADLDGNNIVDGKDLAIMMYYFGKKESEYINNSFNVNPDINGDKIVDGDDLVILASHFGLKK